MATPASPKPYYHDPALGRNHSRRSSTRKSFTSWSGPSFDSPRTLCPSDGDAFSFDAAHLSEWYIPQEDLWRRLPLSLQKALMSVQHGGAAVLTGFDRLDKHTKNREASCVANKVEEDELLVQLDALPSPGMSISREGSNLSVFTDSPSLGSPALSSSQSTSTSPVSPICLTPLDAYMSEKRERSRERSFTTPLEPHDYYYRTELSHLRTEALPRLRHATLKVDTEWYEAKQTGAFSADDIKNFETWFMEKKFKIGHLNERAKYLSGAIGLSSTGLGWTAP
ncbi:hypothetical protein P280DRAFT_72647 [Massarina eburnea CBS 473.64]|uniref:Uncharacterized protein n=1 Tax=Massarina eburnea CBS 473.64 TaxID=1395130 RepID=A0A6A6RUW7_9PLEO|nr:hypothetical protein P280DRAFT_72647 [Massarina eburnea CBS 473.64]